MAVGIKDVGKRAGVSMSTVSQVLNGNATIRIAPATQDKVRRVALEMGYEPNRFAKSLIAGSTSTVGLILPDLKNPFFVHLLEKIELGVLSAGYQVMLDADYEHKRDGQHAGNLKGWPVDGIVMWALRGENLSHVLGKKASNTPVVYITAQKRIPEGDTIYIDTFSAACDLAQHFIDSGYRRISYVLPFLHMIEDPTYEPRYCAYVQKCAEHGLELGIIETSPRVETLEAGWHTGQKIAALPLSQRPEALLCHNDVIAIGVYHGLLRGGLKIPQDIAIAGFDGIEEGRFLDKPLTTSVIPIEEISRAAISLLLRKMQDADFSSKDICICPSFCLGETTKN